MYSSRRLREGDQMIKAYAASEAGGELKPLEYDPGPLGRHEVEVSVEHCGICHSDLSMLDDLWGMATFPLVPGHEVVGTVAEVGEHVTSVKPGDRVGLGWHSGYCMTCPSCMGGDHNLCADAEGTLVGRHGGFADRVRARAAAVVALPEGIDMASVTRLILVDIRQWDRIGRFQQLVDDPNVEVHVYDHHPPSGRDIQGDVEVYKPYGASVTLMVELLQERSISLAPEEATVLMLGIYEDRKQLMENGR